jgi:superfamily II DNA or RNA helicase
MDRNHLLENLFGNQCLTIERSEVAENVAPAKVIMLDASDLRLGPIIDSEIQRTVEWRRRYWKGQDWELLAIVTWQVCIKRGIVGNRARNAAAISTALNHRNDSVLMLVNEIEHGETLAAQIPGATLCFSRMGKKIRQETLESFKSGTIKCIVATSLADEGLDIPIANVLILVSGGRSSAKTEQRTGRVLRLYQGKDHGLIYDFMDTFQKTMASHARRRMALYHQLGYQISTP